MKKIIIYTIEILIAAAIIWYDQRLFLLYFFIIVLWKIDSKIEFLRKLIRVFGVIDEARLLAIARHLNVTEAQMNKVLKEALDKLSEEQRKLLEKDFKDIQL